MLSPHGLRTLGTKLFFTQLRFFCHKKIPGRTFDIATTTNSSGKKVIKYFTAQINVRPESCGSYYPLSDDNSNLTGLCAQWGGQSSGVGKWHQGGSPTSNRLLNHAAFVSSEAHWLVERKDGRWECDDYSVDGKDAKSSGDFCKIFVR